MAILIPPLLCLGVWIVKWISVLEIREVHREYRQLDGACWKNQGLHDRYSWLQFVGSWSRCLLEPCIGRGNEIDLGFDSLSVLEPFVKAGKVRAIAVANPTRTCYPNYLPSFCETNTYFVDNEYNNFSKVWYRKTKGPFFFCSINL